MEAIKKQKEPNTIKIQQVYTSCCVLCGGCGLRSPRLQSLKNRVPSFYRVGLIIEFAVVQNSLIIGEKKRKKT